MDDPRISIVEITESLFSKAFQLFASRSDKEWGITDCLSFIIMEEGRITQALTADEHFAQAGFHALLLKGR
jgi:predicted nucleic acid-binding protein